MQYYLWIKLIHILSSTILFGTGIGTAAVMLYGHLSKDIRTVAEINRYVVLADAVFTAPTVILQPLSGLILIYVGGFTLTWYWIWVSLLFYVLAVACWIPVVILQIKLRNLARNAVEGSQLLPPLYSAYFKYWFILGWFAFFIFLYIFYLMVFKPI